MYLLVLLISDTKLNDNNITNTTPDGPEVGRTTLAGPGGKHCLLMLASYNMDCLANAVYLCMMNNNY